MISKIVEKRENGRVMLLYIPDGVLEYDLCKMLEKSYDIKEGTKLRVNTEEELKEGVELMKLRPFWGGDWLMLVDMSDISIEAFVNSLKEEKPKGVKVYIVRDYRSYKKLLNLEVIKGKRYRLESYYLGKLTRGDIRYIDKYYSEKNNRLYFLPDNLQSYVYKIYSTDVRGVSRLYRLIESGESVEKELDIQELIGLGKQTIDKYVISVLTVSYTDDKSLKRVLKNRVLILKDLNKKYSYEVIRNVLERKLDTLLDIKGLIIRGKLWIKGVEDKIPDCYNESVIRSMLKYKSTIVEEISILDILRYKKLLDKYRSYGDEEVLLLSLVEYTVRRKKEGVKRRKRKS